MKIIYLHTHRLLFRHKFEAQTDEKGCEKCQQRQLICGIASIAQISSAAANVVSCAIARICDWCTCWALWTILSKCASSVNLAVECVGLQTVVARASAILLRQSCSIAFECITLAYVEQNNDECDNNGL